MGRARRRPATTFDMFRLHSELQQLFVLFGEGEGCELHSYMERPCCRWYLHCSCMRTAFSGGYRTSGIDRRAIGPSGRNQHPRFGGLTDIPQRHNHGGYGTMRSLLQARPNWA